MIKKDVSNDVDYDELIEKILELSKERKIIWEYLDENEILYQHLKVTPKKDIGYTLSNDYVAEIVKSSLNLKTYFDTNASFYARIGENYIVLLRNMKKNEENVLAADRIKLMLVPHTFKGIKTIEETDRIMRLHNYVKAQFPDIEDIINDIFHLK